jgi:hypothetical protein
MEMELFFILMEGYIKEHFKKIINQEKVFKNFLMAQSIMDSLKMVLNKEKEYFNGRMDKSIKVNGRKGKKMEVEFGKAAKEKVISDNGKMAWFKALVFIFQKMVIDMRDNLKIHKNMV